MIPKTLSATSLNLFLSYPEAWYLKYIVGIRPATKAINLLFGSAVHEGVAAFILGQPYEKEIKKLLKKEATSLTKEERDFVYQDAIKMMDLYVDKGPYFEPLEVEVKQKTFLKHPATGEELVVPWVYKMDLITTDGMIVDHKTTKAEMKKQDWSYRNQGISYWMCYRSRFNKKPSYFVENQLVKQKRNPRIVQKFYQYSEDDEAWFFGLCKRALKRMEDEDWYNKPMFKTFFPNPLQNLCQTNW